MKNIISYFQAGKGKKRISILTCYDYTFARILNQTNVDALLVGDSLGMVMQGHSSTLPVTLEEMIYHTKAVRRGALEKFIILDMPFLSYQSSLEEGIRNCGRALKESGADAIKLEGADEPTLKLIQRLQEIGIPVMGHIGLTPQYFQTLGGYKLQGKDEKSQIRILQQAKDLESSGVFSIVIEMVPEELGKKITESIHIPTIGIGAGRFTNGQVLVLQDMLGMNSQFQPKFVKRYENLEEKIIHAIETYHKEVEAGVFPGEEHVYLNV